jgi:predicted AAA+ superfamily ATPase
LAAGERIEVDFVLGDMQVAVEAKSGARITRDHLSGLRALKEDHPRVARRIVVCREPRARKTEDGIEVLPVASFVRQLWAGDLA